MTVHKLSAGQGYTYLTRQVASGDEVRSAHQSLADYYTARGNPPGVWMGVGADVLGVSGREVSEAQMRALFGAGRHPDAEAMVAAGAAEVSTRLGAVYPSYADLAPYADRINARIEEFTTLNGRPPSATERKGIAANEARRGRRAVAGFDLVFSPVKSASVLWALGGPEIRRAVEAAHHQAMSSTLAWVERHAAYTRTGRGGVAQNDADGLVFAAFDHRESRSGDPDLHTHVAVSNKVHGVDGKWRSLDARALYALGVAASERYNTRLEDALVTGLGVRFAERASRTTGKRAVREIVGVPHELVTHFSQRRTMIETRLSELRAEYRTAHGREPGRAVELRLAQQATLETREGKGPGRTLHEQVEDWSRQARTIVGRRRLQRLVADCIGHHDEVSFLDAAARREIAERVVRAVSEQRSTWTLWNLYAEAERQMRALRFPSVESRDSCLEAVVDEATAPALSIRIGEPELLAELDAMIRASDGQSLFVPHGSERFTTSEILLAEDRLVDAGRAVGAPHLDHVVLEAALAIDEARSGVQLDEGQRELVEAFALSPYRLVVGIGPAGAGKTTAMRALTQAWHSNGGRVVALATSSKAAEVLGNELGIRTENLHKFLFEYARASDPADEWFSLHAGDLVLVDEAGMAGTLQLDRLVRAAEESRAAVRLLGDPAQLASVDAGGALRLLEREIGAAYLTDLHRFADPREAAATLGLRRGNPASLEFYASQGRIQSGASDAMLVSAYDAWAADARQGLTSILIAGTGQDVAAINTRARDERVAIGKVEQDGVELHDGTTAGAGDWVITRANARTLRTGREGWVRNGDTWEVVSRHRDGSMTVRRLDGKGRVRLPADYVKDSVELGYALTAHRAQGTTTDTAHVLVTTELSREALYVASTRGRLRTTWYAATDTPLDLDCVADPEGVLTAREVLTRALARTDDEGSARETIHRKFETATSLATQIQRYEHAWVMAAKDVLRNAAVDLPQALRREMVDGPGSAYLARVLAMAAGSGIDAQRLLTAAVHLDELDRVRSPALVVATRIQDHRHDLGVPSGPPPPGPLPWLPPPNASHPGWLAYLQQRGRLIERRAEELGSLAEAYREQYGAAEQGGSLGEPPRPGSDREIAYRLALQDLSACAPLPRARQPESRARPRPLLDRRRHHLTR
jgi:conjugative relaxase-like TrwC/TraI family protein